MQEITVRQSIIQDLLIKNVTYFNAFTGEFLRGDIAVKDGVFTGAGDYIGRQEIDGTDLTMVPGLIDSHCHLESSIISPSHYASAVIPHGTTTIFADPHEIANVLGVTGILYLLSATENIPLDVFFLVPSCVPATKFDESGAEISYNDIQQLLTNERIIGLGEVMNYSEVIAGEYSIHEKIKLVQKTANIIDGHAPSLFGNSLNDYVRAGIQSDHECITAEEAIEKIRTGLWIMIREGTASKNLDALLPLCNNPYFGRCTFCTDDKHPGDLEKDGQIDYIIREAVKKGADITHLLRMATINAATRFNKTDRGAIAPGRVADFILLSDISSFTICSVWKSGRKMYDNNADPQVTEWEAPVINKILQRTIIDSVHIQSIFPESFRLKSLPAKVIGLVNGQLTTTDEGYASDIDLSNDIIKLCVVERHHATGHIGIAFLKGYGLKAGAIATTIAHDAHNLIIAGTNDQDIACAAKCICDMHGGIAVVSNGKILNSLALPIAGLMCAEEASVVQNKIDELKATARRLGVHNGIDPIMTLSFAALPVIPKLKLTTRGIVDVDAFELLSNNKEDTIK